MGGSDGCNGDLERLMGPGTPFPRTKLFKIPIPVRRPLKNHPITGIGGDTGLRIANDDFAGIGTAAESDSR
jgi:hypothetical protein